MLYIFNNAIHWTNCNALRLCKMPHAFCAFIRINFINHITLINSRVRTYWLADIAINAFISDYQRHNYLPNLFFNAAATSGGTNAVISPPSVAISRTRLDEIDMYFSDGTKKILSIVGFKCLFILAN